MAKPLTFAPPPPAHDPAKDDVDDLVQALHESGLLRVIAGAARAYQLRYLSRRAVAALDAQNARRLSLAWLAQSLQPLKEEPVKSIVTLSAAHVLWAFGDKPIQTVMDIITRWQSIRVTS